MDFATYRITISTGPIKEAPPAYTEIAEPVDTTPSDIRGQIFKVGKQITKIVPRKVKIDKDGDSKSMWFKNSGQPFIYHFQSKSNKARINEYHRLYEFYDAIKVDREDSEPLLHYLHIAKKGLHKKDLTNPQVIEAYCRFMRWYGDAHQHPL